MDSFHKLAEYFREFPGIGPRQAKRFVYFLLTKDKKYLETFTRLIHELPVTIHRCTSCFHFFESTSSKTVCAYCSDPKRDPLLMILARDIDLETVERSKTFSGKYFVLGGTLPILEKNPEEKIRVDALGLRLKNDKSITEIILALSANSEGENTADFVERYIKDNFPNFPITRLGRGLSTGTELEYSDPDTIKNALKNRF